MAKKLDSDIKRLKSCKNLNASQNIEFLTDVDGEYTDLYLEQLEQDEAFTQTDVADEYFGMKDAPCIPPPPCSCLTNVEMPWDLILIPPTPKKRPPPEEESADDAKTVEETRAELKQLTVSPITGDQLLTMTQDFLADSDVEQIDKLRNQILVERDKVEREFTVVHPFNADKAESDVGDDSDEYVPCRPRPPLKSFQVYDPECEVFNEPYLDRMMKYVCEDEMEEAGPCTSHVEMPWHQLELPRNVLLRKGRAPCERRQTTSADPHRKCGPNYREQLRRHRETFGCVSNSSCGIIACMSKEDREQFDTQIVKQSPQEATSKEGESTSQTEMSPKTKTSLKFICPSNAEQVTPPKKIISCLKKTDKQPRAYSSMPMIGLKGSSCPCPSKAQSVVSSATEDAPPDKPACKSRTERIAALLDSCKKEMEPIKDGIVQLRERIKELKFPDLITCQDPNQQSYEPGRNMGTGSSMGFVGMPAMCYPPAMMCYPYPPCMYPPGGVAGMDPFAANADVTKEKDPGRKKKCKCKSKRHRRSDSHQRSSEYEDRHRSRHKDSKSNRSRSRSRSALMCTCRAQESKTVICPSRHRSKRESKSKFSVSASEPNKSPRQSKIPRFTSCASRKSGSNVVDSMQKNDGTRKSNVSNIPEKSLKSCLSRNSGLSNKSCNIGTCPAESSSRTGQQTEEIKRENLKGNSLSKSACNVDTCKICDHSLTNQKTDSGNLKSSSLSVTKKSVKSDLSNKSATCNGDSGELRTHSVTAPKADLSDITEKDINSSFSKKSALSDKSACADKCSICNHSLTTQKTDANNFASCTSNTTEKSIRNDLPNKTSACDVDNCEFGSPSKTTQKSEYKSCSSNITGRSNLSRKSLTSDEKVVSETTTNKLCEGDCKKVTVSETRTPLKKDRSAESQPKPKTPEEPTIQPEDKATPDGTQAEADKSIDSLCQKNSMVMVKSNSTQKSNCDLSTAPQATSKEQTAVATQLTTGKKKCRKCAVCQRPQKEKVDVGVEVKQGRPVEEGKEKVCTATCNKHKSRDA